MKSFVVALFCLVVAAKASSVSEEFANFKQTYNKQYASAKEVMYYFRVVKFKE